MKQLESIGFPRDKIIDGRVFQVQNLDFPRLLKEGVAYGFLESPFKDKPEYLVFFSDSKSMPFEDNSACIYPRLFTDGQAIVKLGIKSYIGGATLGGRGLISVGNFSSISWAIAFNMGRNINHNYFNVGSYSLKLLDWSIPPEFWPSQEQCKINIGSDVWIGLGSKIKCVNPNKPLIIGDGAIIASDSVVVKDVPPYTIVGGNPAKIIKYRFPPHVIEALLRIKWWDWSLDKIHDNFKYFNDVEKFISLHDK